MNFRKAKEEDLEQVWGIVAAAKEWMNSKGPKQWTDQYPAKQVFDHDIKHGHCYLLEIDGKIAGTFAVVPGPDAYYEQAVEGQWLYKGQNYAVACRIAINIERKGKGLGQIILKECERICRQRKFDSIRVSTYEHNTQMKKLMDTHGYTNIGKFAGLKDVILAYQILLPTQALQ